MLVWDSKFQFVHQVHLVVIVLVFSLLCLENQAFPWFDFFKNFTKIGYAQLKFPVMLIFYTWCLFTFVKLCLYQVFQQVLDSNLAKNQKILNFTKGEKVRESVYKLYLSNSDLPSIWRIILTKTYKF